MNKPLLITLSGVTITAGVIIGGLKLGQAASTYTDPNVAQTLQNHTERLDNHEARITNTENDVTDLQNKTSTPPSTKTVIVPQVVTQPSETKETSPPVPSPVVVTSASFGVDVHGGHWCDVVYSDGSYTKLPNNLPTSCSDYIGQLKN